MDDHGAFIPTAKQIETGCAMFQRTWTEQEEIARRSFFAEPGNKRLRANQSDVGEEVEYVPRVYSDFFAGMDIT